MNVPRPAMELTGEGKGEPPADWRARRWGWGAGGAGRPPPPLAGGGARVTMGDLHGAGGEAGRLCGAAAWAGLELGEEPRAPLPGVGEQCQCQSEQARLQLQLQLQPALVEVSEGGKEGGSRLQGLGCPSGTFPCSAGSALPPQPSPAAQGEELLKVPPQHPLPQNSQARNLPPTQEKSPGETQSLVVPALLSLPSSRDWPQHRLLKELCTIRLFGEGEKARSEARGAWLTGQTVGEGRGVSRTAVPSWTHLAESHLPEWREKRKRTVRESLGRKSGLAVICLWERPSCIFPEASGRG